MGRKIKATVAAVALAGTMAIATPPAADAAPVAGQVVASSCVQTSFWGRLWALTFQRSYASYLWLNRC
jgi:hypothetical protein